LFENLLQWSRATNDSSKFESEAIDIKVLALSTISLYEVSAYKKEIEIECNINKPLYAWANKNLLSTVLRNLIDNAIKFTFPLGIITVNAIETSNEIVIEVADSGKGITDNEKEKLFNIQSNTSTPGTLNEKGTGLGLVLCKEFVEINGGKIWVIDNPNKGSIFKFTIPKYINLIPNSHDTEKSTS
jgi:signal transduction histidine kinase